MGIRTAKQCTMNRWGKAKLIMIIITGYKYYLTRCFQICQLIMKNDFHIKKSPGFLNNFVCFLPVKGLINDLYWGRILKTLPKEDGGKVHVY